ncbi:unnamed protein product, partial [Cylindrotheca closterium]
MAMGLKPAPDFAQYYIEKTLRDLKQKGVEIYIDDVGLFSNSYEEHMALIQEVLQRLQAAGFKINPLKCEWCVQETDFLGHWLTPEGVKPWKKKIDAILKMSAPTNVTELRAFLGAVTFYRHMWLRRSHLLRLYIYCVCLYLLKSFWQHVCLIRINMYTAPAYFMAIIVVFTIYMLSSKHFKDRDRSQPPTDIKKKSAKRAEMDDYSNQMTIFFGLSIYDCCILWCMMLNFSTKGSIGCFETLGISIADSLFGMSSTIAGTMVGACGTIGVISLLSMGRLSQFMSDIQLICGGVIVMAMGFLSLTLIDDDSGDNSSWIYLLSIFMIYSIGYPIGHTVVIGLFSKIVGRRPQGTLLGWFAAAGSLAQLVFPIVAGYVEHYLGFLPLFYILTGILAVFTLITLLGQRTLSMLSQYERFITFKSHIIESLGSIFNPSK